MRNAIIASFFLSSLAQALEVHEWGTFTVLSGSNGAQVSWYQTSGDLAGLPEFVSQAGVGKGALLATVRMETPVIYFYPEKKMEVSVEVSFENGTLTETFPQTRPDAFRPDPAMGLSVLGKWSGTLHSPTSKAALAEIPAIFESGKLESYGAAREVPDAWIFESDLKEVPGLKVQPYFPQMEKFIFYRGAGNAYVPISATMEGHRVTVQNESDSELPFGVAMRVRDGKAAWVAIPSVPGRRPNEKPEIGQAEFTLSEPDRSLDIVESELAGVWKNALARNGLTPAEASAMVETWRKTWFRESGDRIFTIVPRKVTDAMLPLKVTPTPAKTERVFVARIELLSPDREQRLVELLSSTKEPDEGQLEAFDGLALGRFANGAMEIATQVQAERMRRKFYEIQEFEQENLKIFGR